MNIALMAHDRKKELMVQFCIAYCGILAEHNLCATHVTGKLVSEATGLPITLYLHADQGGAQQRRPQNQASFDGSDLLGLLSMLK